MHYEITLPADYDMGVIRHRVATRASVLDSFAGLGLKAYLVRERGTDGSPVNQYAPFYLWNSVHGMNRFLWEGGFRGIVDDFGRPPVQHWTGLAFERGPAVTAVPRTATRRTVPVPPGDPTAAVNRALDELASRAGESQVHSTALAIDPRRWELVHFTLWAADSVPDGDTGTVFRVVGLNTPGLADIEAGRHW